MWRPIYKHCSLPYDQGVRFWARINECTCTLEELNKNNCSKTRPCIRDFITLNEFRFCFILDDNRITKNHFYTKEGLVARYKYWKPIYGEQYKREDIFVCQCIDVSIPKSLKDRSLDDDSKLSCCHCKQLVNRCSENCRNYKRGW